ncbi:MAG: hypothetical protein ACLU0O_10030 [Collinsella sp.]
MPSIAVGATVALVVSQYTPLVAKTVAATPAQRAAGADLKTVDTSNVRRRRQRRQPNRSTLGLWYGRRNLKDSTYEAQVPGFRAVSPCA